MRGRRTDGENDDCVPGTNRRPWRFRPYEGIEEGIGERVGCGGPLPPAGVPREYTHVYDVYESDRRRMER